MRGEEGAGEDESMLAHNTKLVARPCGVFVYAGFLRVSFVWFFWTLMSSQWQPRLLVRGPIFLSFPPHAFASSANAVDC